MVTSALAEPSTSTAVLHACIYNNTSPAHYTLNGLQSGTALSNPLLLPNPFFLPLLLSQIPQKLHVLNTAFLRGCSSFIHTGKYDSSWKIKNGLRLFSDASGLSIRREIQHGHLLRSSITPKSQNNPAYLSRKISGNTIMKMNCCSDKRLGSMWFHRPCCCKRISS